MRKWLYYISTGISILSLVLAMVYTTKPDMLSGILVPLNITPEMMQSFLTVLGYGGLTGTAGFGAFQLMLKKLKVDTETQNSKSEEKVAMITAQQTLRTDTLLNKAEEILVTATSQNKATEAVYNNMKVDIGEALKYIHLVANIAIADASKTLENPYVSDEEKEAIKKAVDEYVEARHEETT